MKILLIKLGALGDVLRTTPLLTALKRRYPKAKLRWVVDKSCAPVLEKVALIDELEPFGPRTLETLRRERFDLVINLDKESEALDAVMAAQADKKMGFGRTPEGKLCALDELSDYALRLGIDDELKFRHNKKTYQQISFEQAGMSFNGEEYLFDVDPASEAFAVEWLNKLGAPAAPTVTQPIIGLNTGSGRRFAGKRLPIESYIALAEKFTNDLKAAVFLLGGEDEIDRNLEIVRRSHAKIFNTGSHSIHRFAAILRRCSVVITGDTTAMHIAIATRTPSLVHFGSTCAEEIELYGRGRKIVSSLDCAPCYKRDCPIDEQCMKDMTIAQLFVGARLLLGEKAYA